MEYKRTGDTEKFTKRYQEEVLGKLDQIEVLRDLDTLTSPYHVGPKNVVLVCYEKPTDFCHRHLIAGWLGVEIKEI